MELLIPAVITLITALTARLSKKFGVNLGRAITLIVAFVLSGIAAYLYNWLPVGFKTEMTLLFSSQMAIYEVIIKTIIKPAIDPDSNIKVLPESIRPQ